MVGPFSIGCLFFAVPIVALLFAILVLRWPWWADVLTPFATLAVLGVAGNRYDAYQTAAWVRRRHGAAEERNHGTLDAKEFETPTGIIRPGDLIRVSAPRLEDRPEQNRDITGRYLGIQPYNGKPHFWVQFGDHALGLRVPVPVDHADRITKISEES